jgi:hypothetical protein
MLKTIVEEHTFVAELDALQSKYPRIYEIKDTVSWKLAQDPQAGQPLSNNPECKVFAYPPGANPIFFVFYKTSRNHVHLLSIVPA